MVKILKSRFQEMYKLRNKSERFLGMTIENYPKEKDGRITYRSLQRCLTEGNMQHETLMLCAEILDCDPQYLTGELNEKSLLPITQSPDYDPEDTKDLEGTYSPEKIEDIMNLRKEIDLDWKRHTDSNGLTVGHYEDALLEESLTYFEKWITRSYHFLRVDDPVIGKHSFQEYEKDYEDYHSDYGDPDFITISDVWETAIDAIISEMTEFYKRYNLKKDNPEEYKRRINEYRKIAESSKDRKVKDN